MLLRGRVSLPQTIHVRFIEYIKFQPDLEPFGGEYIVGGGHAAMELSFPNETKRLLDALLG
jgi:hypothetical protein